MLLLKQTIATVIVVSVALVVIDVVVSGSGVSGMLHNRSGQAHLLSFSSDPCHFEPDSFEIYSVMMYQIKHIFSMLGSHEVFG